MDRDEKRPLSLLIMCGLIWGLCIFGAIFGIWRLCCTDLSGHGASRHDDGNKREKATQCAVADGDIHYVELEDLDT